MPSESEAELARPATVLPVAGRQRVRTLARLVALGGGLSVAGLGVLTCVQVAHARDALQHLRRDAVSLQSAVRTIATDPTSTGSGAVGAAPADLGTPVQDAVHRIQDDTRRLAAVSDGLPAALAAHLPRVGI